jgi:hypothetical protein
MSRNKSRLEFYVENYLKSHKIAGGEYNYLRKAKAYIDYALFYDECDFTEPILNLYTLRDNQFTRTVYNMMLNMGINLYRKSLQRTSDLLQKYITCSNC